MKPRGVRGKTNRIALFFIAVLTACSIFQDIPVRATEATRKQLEEAKEKKKQSENALGDTKDDIAEMNEEKSSLQGQLSTLNEQLTEVSSNLEDLEEQIDNKQVEIENTMAELDAAKKQEEEQYASMKKRIQYIYEKQNFMLLEMLLESTSFADFLNHNDYVEQLSAYDRKMFNQYVETRKTIEQKEATLKEELAQLEHERNQARSRIESIPDSTLFFINGTASLPQDDGILAVRR